MRINYSQEVDALYIRFNEKVIADTEALNDDFLIDYDNNRSVVGFEVLNFGIESKCLTVKGFEKVLNK